MRTFLASVLLIAAPLAAQQINPNNQINWAGNGAGQTVYAQSGDTIASIEATCVSTCTYVLTSPQTITLSANHTLSSNVNLQFGAGGKWTVNGAFTLTIPGQVQGALTTHFAGSSAIRFAGNQSLVPVEWFGAVADFNGTTGTDNTTAIQNAINSVQSGQILLQQGKYAVSNTLTITSSNVGIKGTVQGGVIATAVAGTISPSVIINTSSTTTTLQVGGTSTSAMTLYNTLDHFALERSVAPSVFTAEGLYMNYAAGAVLEYVQSMDSGRDFHFHSVPQFGIGIIKHTWASWGYNGITEGAAFSLTGYFLDSNDGNGENSITIEDSAATSPLPNTDTTYGMFFQGTALNDVDVIGFGTATLSYGIWMQYSGPGSGIGSQDLHFINSTNDGCWITCILVQNVISTARASVDFDGGWANAQSTSSATPTISIFQSNGVSIRGMQISNNTTSGFGVLLNQSSGNIVSDNTFIGTIADDVVVEAGSESNVVNGNNMTNNATTAIDVINNSSHNTMIGNSIGGIGTVTTGFNFDSTSQLNVGPSYDNVNFATTPIADASGLNGGFFPTVYKVQEFAGDNEIGTNTLVAVQSGAGSGATVGLATGSNDTSGIITLVTGTGPTSGASLLHITFANAKLKTPILLLTPASSGTTALGVWATTVSKSVISINSGPSAPAASTTYVWNYVVVGLNQ